MATTQARAELIALAGLTRAVLAKIAQPTLAIYGEHSRCLTTCRALPTAMPSCRTYIMSGVGHFYPVIKPAAVAQLVLEFLHGLERPRAAPSTAATADHDPQVRSLPA
jgi:pimeloyl-ACP methyl ester carboxylesterase